VSPMEKPKLPDTQARGETARVAEFVDTSQTEPEVEADAGAVKAVAPSPGNIADAPLPLEPVLKPGPSETSSEPSTFEHMQYWIHGTKASSIKGKAERPLADRSWLPATRDGKFLELTSDAGGFNNIRLAFEAAVVIAAITGRTLILPSKRTWYLLGRTQVGFEDFFNIEDLKKLVPCMTQDEFRNAANKGQSRGHIEANALRNVIAFPSSEAVEASHQGKEQELRFHKADNRVMIDVAPGGKLHDLDVLTVDNGQHRLLATWHTFFVFAEEAHDLALKRLMRDLVHYTDKLYQYAASGVDEMGGWATYTAMHIRRGDFQYQEVKLGAKHLFDNVKPLLERSGKKNIYISTDETNHAFFQPFYDSGYKIKFFKDLQPKIGNVPYHHIGMVEQLISSGSNMFIGTRLSTFSSYTMRLRGYTVGLQNKEIFYADRKYTGNHETDGNEKLMDTSNTQLGGGEMAYFREPQNVWVEEDNRR